MISFSFVGLALVRVHAAVDQIFSLHPTAIVVSVTLRLKVYDTSLIACRRMD